VRSVRLFDCLQYDGDSWQVVAQEGVTLALKNLTTGRIRKVTVAELLGDDSYLPDSPDRLPKLDASAVLETLEPAARRRAEFLHQHVVEVLTGASPLADGGDVEPKPEYHPRNLLGDRIEAKLAELRDAGTPMSERTFRRHLTAYRQDGIAGLVDGRKTSQSSPTGRIDIRLVSLLEAAIDGQTYLSTGTKSRVIAEVKREAEQLGVSIPGRSTLYEALGNLHRSKHPFGNATTRCTQANRPDRAWGGQSPSRPGELVEIDSTLSI
jgi:putative transposase